MNHLSNRELEYTIIGEMIADSVRNKGIIMQLTEDDFSTLYTQQIFAEIKKIVSAGGEADLVTVCAHLSDKAQKAAVEAAGSNIGSWNIRQHAKEIKNYTAKRKIAQTAQAMLQSIHDDSKTPIAICDEAVQTLRQAMPIETREDESLDSILIETYSVLGENMGPNGGGTKTNIPEFDRVTGGLFDGEMTVIGARPGVGKSAFAQYIAMQFVRQGKPVEFFSREMSRIQYGLRIYASESGVSTAKMRQGNVGEPELKKLSAAMQRLYGLPLYINTTARTPEEILAVCHDRQQKNGLGLIVVDYLQLVSGMGGNREQEVSTVSRALKELSKEFKVPVLALSQLNRSTGYSMPTMANLRESGAIEQNADNIIFLHDTGEGENGQKIIRLIIEKQRQGNTGYVDIVFQPDTMQFAELYQQ